ncbi:MAG: L,D-transpeptidase family protein [Campylobacterota bacterium]|nr:L,D-transpeptidase family protein [Campylobacterota bacterium]
MRYIYIWIFLTVLTFGNIIIPQDTKQLLVITADNWETKYASLKRYEKRANSWHQVGKEIEVIIGRNGMGWGLGVHSVPKDAKIIKREGDGKAPAGLFRLGHGFGYQNFNTTFPYATYDTRDFHCVDDSNSMYYNQIVDSRKIIRDYSSHEFMLLKKDFYKYGITVTHNPDNIPQMGSCIFIHLKKPNDVASSGCSMMHEEEIKEILQWLDKSKDPMLLQLPKEKFKTIGFKP